MSDTGEKPVKKSFLRKIFSQAEPAPSKRPKEDPAWKPQAKALEEIAPAAPTPEEVVARDVPSLAAKPDPSPAADIPPAPTVVEAPAHAVPADAMRHAEPAPTFLVEAPAPPPAAEAPGLPVVEDAFTIEPEPAPPPVEAKSSWWSRLRQGLSRSSGAIGTGIGDIFTKRKLDAAMLEDLEDVLIRADLGSPRRPASATPSARAATIATCRPTQSRRSSPPRSSACSRPTPSPSPSAAPSPS